MHDSAYSIARLFFKTYWRPHFRKVLDVGSYDVPGDWSPGPLRDHVPSGGEVTGVDIEAGPGVDIVITDVEQLPFRDETFDVITASSMFEHDTAFWITLLEMARVLKPGGFLYINAPSNGKYHRYPVDNWRFYPDAGLALEKWAVRNGRPLVMIESFTADREKDVWNDFCMIFAKFDGGPLVQRELVSDQYPCRNVRVHGIPSVSRESWDTEDMMLLKEARSRLDANAVVAALAEQSEANAAAAITVPNPGGVNGSKALAATKSQTEALRAQDHMSQGAGISTAELLSMSVAFRQALLAIREINPAAQPDVRPRNVKAKKSGPRT